MSNQTKENQLMQLISYGAEDAIIDLIEEGNVDVNYTDMVSYS